MKQTVGSIPKRVVEEDQMLTFQAEPRALVQKYVLGRKILKDHRKG